MRCITLELCIKTDNDFIVQVKGNQEQLHKDCEHNINPRKVFDKYAEPLVKDRGRVEQRTIEVFEDNLSICDKSFKSCISQIIKINRSRQILNTKTKKYKDTSEISLYISTIRLKAKDYAKIIRGHWSIENSNHHIKDERFFEDKSRIRQKPENMAIIRSFALNLMRANRAKNISLELFRNLANFDNIKKYKYL